MFFYLLNLRFEIFIDGKQFFKMESEIMKTKSYSNSDEKEIQIIMKLSEKSLFSFLNGEPDIYSIEDINIKF